MPTRSRALAVANGPMGAQLLARDLRSRLTG